MDNFILVDAKEMETTVEWMKHNDDKLRVREDMKKTVFFRREYIIPSKDSVDAPEPSISDILSKYPHLLDDGMVSFCLHFFKTRLL